MREYTVKNGYKRCVLEDLNMMGNEISTDQDLTRSYFTKIWSLKILSNVRINLWENEFVSYIFRDYILAKQVLQQMTLIHNVRYLTIAEAYTCLKGVVFAEEIGFSDVIMEGDSRIVIKKHEKPTEQRMRWLQGAEEVIF